MLALPTVSAQIGLPHPIVRLEAILDVVEADHRGGDERRRWLSLKAKLVIVESPALLHVDVIDGELEDCNGNSAGVLGDSPSTPTSDPSMGCDAPRIGLRLDPAAASLWDLYRALSRVRQLSHAHLQLILTAAANGALLYTANGRLVRRVPPHITIDAYVHEARWLCGINDDTCATSIGATGEGAGVPCGTSSGLSLPQLNVDVLSLILSAVGARDFADACRCAPTCAALRAALPHVRLLTLRQSSSTRGSPSGRYQYWAPSPRGLTAAARAAQAERLERLLRLVERQEALRGLRISAPLIDQTVDVLVAGPLARHRLNRLELHCDGGHLGPDAAECLAGWLERSSDVCALGLCNARVGVSGARQIGSALAANTSLESLRLARCGLLKVGLRAKRAEAVLPWPRMAYLFAIPSSVEPCAA